jgi:hypothetical protein
MILRIFFVFILLIGSTLLITYYFSRDEVVDFVTLNSDKSVSLRQRKTNRNYKNHVSLGFLADNIYKFLITTFEEDNEIFLSKKCNYKGCTLSNPAHLPGRAWYLLSHSRVASLGNSPGQLKEKDRVVARQRIKKVFNEWILHADRNSEVYSTHQLFSAYHLYSDPSLLKWFYSRMPFIDNYMKTNIIPTGKLEKLEPYLTMALARQFANGASVVLDEKYREIIFEDSSLTDEKKKEAESYIEQAQILLNSFTRNDNPAVLNEPSLIEDFISTSDANEELTFPQFICFEKWAKVSLLEAFKQDSQYSSQSRELEKELMTFFDAIQKYDHNDNSMNFSTLQSVLSCIHALSDMKRVVSDFPDTLDIRENLLVKYVLPQGDYSREENCAADGGFFSTFEKKDTTGCQRNKSLVDNSWLYFLIDEELRKVEITK